MGMRVDWSLVGRLVVSMGAAVLGACANLEAPRVHVDLRFPIPGTQLGVRIALTKEGNDTRVDQAGLDICVQPTFVDSTGAQTVGPVVRLPEGITIPQGTIYTFCRWVRCPPAEMPGGGDRRHELVEADRAPVDGVGTPPIEGPIVLWGFPTPPDWGGSTPLGNTTFSLIASGMDPTRLTDTVAAWLALGPGAPVPAGIDLTYYSRLALVGDHLEYQLGNIGPIIDFQMTWNGVEDYANLGQGWNVYTEQLPNGWTLLHVRIPSTDIENQRIPGVPSRNSYETRYWTTGSRTFEASTIVEHEYE